MLKNVIEDYLISIKEVQFFLPFKHLLEAKQFYDIHLIHGSTEFGKDFIAKKKSNDTEFQFSFQIKAGDINLNKFKTEVQPQLLEACTNKLSHPNFDESLYYKVIFVTTGNVLPPATIAFQEFNRYLKTRLNLNEIETWEKDVLISDFINVGLEPFFTLHKSPALIGRFFNFYSKIINEQPFNFLTIESYSLHWLNFDWKKSENRLQIFFEACFFSKLLFERGRHYETVLILAALVRVLLKNGVYQEYKPLIDDYAKDVFKAFFIKFNDYKNNNSILIEECRGFFSIFHYPENCLKSLELFAIYILIVDQCDNRIFSTFLKILKNEKGAEHPISDNYAVSIALISLALLKLNRINEVKRFLNNVTIWLCNRYKDVGLSSVGSTEREEYEQLLSEYLDGFAYSKKQASFIASAILDICFILGDKDFYADIANELRAASIILSFYHVLNYDAVFTHAHPQILSQHDNDFSLELNENYSRIIEYERRSTKLKFEGTGILFLAFLLRDRYFPTLMKELI